MKRFNAHIGSIDAALQERPEVFDPVRVNLTVNILLSMVDHVMRVFILKFGIRRKGVTVNSRSGLNVASNFAVKRATAHVRHNHSANLAVSFKKAHDSDFALAARAVDSASANVRVRIAGLAADECFVNFDVARKLAAVVALQSKSNTLEHEPSRLL